MVKIVYFLLYFFLIFKLEAQAQPKNCGPGENDGKFGQPYSSNAIDQVTGDTIRIPVVVPRDPNEIIGPKGYDSNLRWVSSKDNLPYKILFENDPEFATAPAQKVIIYMPIHSKLNPASLQIRDFGFGNLTFTVPPNTLTYTQRLDLRDSLGLFVNVIAGLDITNRRAFWVFESIDPATGIAASLPANAGFLPVNDSAKGNGEGYVTFSIQPLSSDRTRDTITATADILFDINEPLATNVETNLIDAVAPASKVNNLPAFVDSVFTISWAGNDDSLGVGVKGFDLYYSKNGGPYNLYSGNIDSSSVRFSGDLGASYGFYTLASDFTGNKEEPKSNLTVFTTVLKSGYCPGNNIVFNSLSPVEGYSYQWQVDKGDGFVNVINGDNYMGANSKSLAVLKSPTSWSGYKFRCVLVKDGVETLEGSQTLRFFNTWVGTISSAWENPSNWSCGVLPDQYTDVIVTVDAVNELRLSSNGTCRKMNLSSGAKFYVGGGAGLDIKGVE